MAPAPSEIRSRRFALTRRGYDPDEVHRFLAEVADDVRTLAAAARRKDRFREAGREVEAVLRTASEEARRLHDDAERAGRTLREEAALAAAQLQADADRDRDEAKRLLLRSQERAASIVREAEDRAAGIVSNAEALARSRTSQIVDQAQRRLERLVREERKAKERLLGAQADLQSLISRVSGSEGRHVIDLTDSDGDGDDAADDPTDDLTGDDAASDPEPPAADVEEEGTADTPSSFCGPLAAHPRQVAEQDPVAEMIRDAVGRAVRHSSGQGDGDPVPPGARSESPRHRTG